VGAGNYDADDQTRDAFCAFHAVLVSHATLNNHHHCNSNGNPPPPPLLRRDDDNEAHHHTALAIDRALLPYILEYAGIGQAPRLKDHTPSGILAPHRFLVLTFLVLIVALVVVVFVVVLVLVLVVVVGTRVVSPVQTSSFFFRLYPRRRLLRQHGSGKELQQQQNPAPLTAKELIEVQTVLAVASACRGFPCESERLRAGGQQARGQAVGGPPMTGRSSSDARCSQSGCATFCRGKRGDPMGALHWRQRQW
jgi:hypothetical protein